MVVVMAAVITVAEGTLEELLQVQLTQVMAAVLVVGVLTAAQTLVRAVLALLLSVTQVLIALLLRLQVLLRLPR
jgi:hypothetical protein